MQYKISIRRRNIFISLIDENDGDPLILLQNPVHYENNSQRQECMSK